MVGRHVDCLLRAFRRWNRIKRYDHPVIWIRRVAINIDHDLRRSETRRRRREDNDHRRADIDHETPDGAEKAAAHLDLVDLFKRLTPQQRAVAALFYVEDISVAEIAASLDLSAGAVKFHLHQARSSLKSILEAAPEVTPRV